MTKEEFIKKHGMGSKEHWINYCEVVITPDGSIYDAVPSHTEWAYKYAMKELGCSREELYSLIPTYASPIDWICERFNLLMLWYDFGMGSETVISSDKVRSVLKSLKLDGLVRKDIFSNLKICREFSICGYERV